MKEIFSLQHALIKHLVKLRQNTDYRYDHQAIVVEGSKIIAELSRSQTFKTLLISAPELIPKKAKAEEIILTSPAIIQKVSGLSSPEGILGEIAMPQRANLKGKHHIVALDHINDPGNLGTILRTALAFGWEGVFFLNHTCDPFNDKALRASRGAVFHLPMAHGNWEDLKQLMKENQLQPFVADLSGTSFKKNASADRVLLVLGNEAHGPSPESLAACQAITIPMSGKTESLNVSVAAGILLCSLGPSLKVK